MDGITASETITDVIGSSWSDSDSLSSPIDYSRTIMYPEDDYFVIFDRFDGTEEWTYRNVFRPTSLSITPTGSGVIGHVKGDLRIDTTAYDWLSLPYKSETRTGITTNSLTWDTTNPYGDRVSLNIYSAPASEVIVTKHAGRIAGYGTESEVYSPIVYLKDGPEKDLYRITVLTSNYLNEDKKNTEEIPVSGNGNAIRVSATDNTDVIYSGDGSSSFGAFSTDAETAFIRTPASAQDYSYTLTKGTYLNKNGAALIKSTGTESVSLNKEGNSVALVVDGASAGQVSLSQLNTDIGQVLKDGVPYTGWHLSADKSAIIITTAAGSHEYSFLTSGEVMPTPPVTEAGFTANPAEGQAPLSVQFTDTSTNAVSWSWAFGDGTRSGVKNPSHTYAEPGIYSVILTATGEDGSDTEEKTNYITVTAEAATDPSAPVAAFWADVTAGQAPLTVQFTDTTTNSPESYSWSFGDGTTAAEENPRHVYTEPGTYAVTLEVTNADGADTETKTGYISVTAADEPAEPAKPVAAFSADSVTGPAPMQVTFTDQSQGIPTSWTWYFGGGASSYEQNPTHTYTEPGTYSVTLRVINAEGIDFESKSGFITVTDEGSTAPVTNPPVAAFSADVVSGTVPLEVTFTDESSNSPESYSWNFGDGWQANVQNPTHTYTEPGIYAVSLEVTNADGADTETKTGYISVTAADEPAETTKPVAAFSADSVTGPAPMQVTFTDQSQGVPTSWTWYFGGGASSREQNPTHTYTEPGTYSVTLRVINAEGIDFESKTGLITVTDEGSTAPVTNPPVAAFSADVVSGTLPLEVTFTDESSDSPDSWSWNFGDGTTAAEENPRHVYTEPGTYAVSLEVTNADGTDTETKTGYISVTAADEPAEPAKPVAAFSADSVTGPAPMQVTFTDQSQGVPTSWTWYFGGGASSYEQNPTHTYTEPGTYSVTLRVINAEGIDFESKTGFITVTDEGSTAPVTNPPVAAFSADVVSGTVPLEVTFTDESSDSPDSWSWNFGDGTTAAEENPRHVYTEPGTYAVSLEVTNADGTDTETKTGYISVTAADEPAEPAKPVAAFSADSVTGPAPMQVTFTDQSQGVPTSWTWYFGGGASSYEQNPTHTYTKPGTYSVTLRVINAEGIDFESKTGYIHII
ncbi:hypothetical protein MKMG_00723 [Methanogenium sp. MK-MG]|nr:hypothetical protein MKMG_00723 [Methanogenium sp. MK-MG]